MASTPSVTGGNAYLGPWGGYEYTVNASTAAFEWKTFIGITSVSPVCTPPTLGVSSPATVLDGVV